MAKVTKTQLKSIVKECLVEILSEGISSASSALTEVASPTPSSNKSKARKPRQPVLNPAHDKVQFGATVDRAVSELTSDPLMTEIFSDTARTTLQERVSAESRRPGAQLGGLASDDPGIDTDFFGQSADRWADLAFAASKKD